MFSALMSDGEIIHGFVSKTRASYSVPKGDVKELHNLLPFACSLFFSDDNWVRIFHLKEAASPGVKLSKVVSKHERPCVTLRWWGAEEKESAATWNSDRESYLTNRPLWWMGSSLKEDALFTSPASGSSSFCVRRGVFPQPQTLQVVVPSSLSLNSQWWVIWARGLKGVWPEEFSICWPGNGVASLLPACCVHPETSLITLALRPAPLTQSFSVQPWVEELLLIWQQPCSLADLFSVPHFVLKSELWFFSASTSGVLQLSPEVSNHCLTTCGYLLLGLTTEPYSCFGWIMLNIGSPCLRALEERLHPRALFSLFLK